MNIINFGSCNIDYVYKVSHFVTPGETISSMELNKFPGGKGLNQTIAAARSGVKVYHVGCIGKDGLFLKELLADAGADVSNVRTFDLASGHAIIQVDEKGENCIILYNGANHMFDREFIDEVLNKFDEGDIVVLQNETNNIEYIIEQAYANKMKVILNPSPFEKRLTEIDLNKIAYLVLNQIEAAEFSGKITAEEICEYFRESYPDLKVMLTLGSKGSMYFDAQTKQFCPCYKVDVKDTTSAGDTFTGYFVSGLVREWDLEKTMQYAAAAAALAVSKAGAAESIPTIQEVEAALPVLKKMQ